MMREDLGNSKKSWFIPQIIEIKLKMTEAGGTGFGGGGGCGFGNGSGGGSGFGGGSGLVGGSGLMGFSLYSVSVAIS